MNQLDKLFDIPFRIRVLWSCDFAMTCAKHYAVRKSVVTAPWFINTNSESVWNVWGWRPLYWLAPMASYVITSAESAPGLQLLYEWSKSDQTLDQKSKKFVQFFKQFKFPTLNKCQNSGFNFPGITLDKVSVDVHTYNHVFYRPRTYVRREVMFSQVCVCSGGGV